MPRHVELIRSGFSLEDDPAAMIGVSRRECVDMLAQGKEDELLDVIFTRYEAYRSHKDIVLVEGTHSGRTPPATLEPWRSWSTSLTALLLLAPSK